MSYSLLVPFILQYCENFDKRPVNILEVGVDHGQTMIPVVRGLVANKQEFFYDAVDIMFHEDLRSTLQTLGPRNGDTQRASILHANSLQILPKMINKCMPTGTRSYWGPYDVILLDGDHNYTTCKADLENASLLSHSDTMMVVDDYATRWSERDMFYGDRPGYENCKTAPRDLLENKDGKVGVKNAVHDFINEYSGPSSWVAIHPSTAGQECDFVILVRKDHKAFDQFTSETIMNNVIKSCGAVQSECLVYYYDIQREYLGFDHPS